MVQSVILPLTQLKCITQEFPKQRLHPDTGSSLFDAEYMMVFFQSTISGMLFKV